MLNQFSFQELTKSIVQENSPFVCQDKEITEFFSNEYEGYAYQMLGKSYCFVDRENKQIVAAFTVSNSSLLMDILPKSRRNKLNRDVPYAKHKAQYPAVLIGQLAVNSNYAGLHLGEELLMYIKAWFILPNNKTGCRYIMVDALNHPKVIDFYTKCGFKMLFNNDEEEWHATHSSARETPERMNTRLMYFNLMLLKNS